MSSSSTSGAAASTALSVPVPDYAPSVVGEFPRIQRLRQIESSIASRSIVDILPTNLSSNARLTDKYLEFRIPGIKGMFLDLAKLILELKLSLTQADGQSKLEDNVNVAFINGTANSMFKSIQVYIGDQMVETNPYYNIWSFIKMLTTFSSAKLKTLGELGNFFNEGKKAGKLSETYDGSYFTNLTESAQNKLKNIKTHGLHLAFPLMSDIASSDQYLCDDVPVRIRLELADEAWYLNTDGNGNAIRSHIDFAKLWVTRLQPYPSALIALNKLLEGGRDTKTLFNKTLYKSMVLGKQQTSIVSDLPWGNVIPERLYLVFIDMSAFSGAYNKNGLFFKHANLSEITVSVNGMNLYKNDVHFPHQCSQLYYTTLEALGIENDTLIEFDSFKNGGRTVMVYSLIAEDIQGTVPLEQSGNLRVSIQLRGGLEENLVILLFGDTKAVLSINAQRRVVCDSRA